jgi:hypothetical protein
MFLQICFKKLLPVTKKIMKMSRFLQIWNRPHPPKSLLWLVLIIIMFHSIAPQSQSALRESVCPVLKEQLMATGACPPSWEYKGALLLRIKPNTSPLLYHCAAVFPQLPNCIQRLVNFSISCCCQRSLVVLQSFVLGLVGSSEVTCHLARRPAQCVLFWMSHLNLAGVLFSVQSL